MPIRTANTRCDVPTPGLVVSIRVNPTDAMSVIDILDRLGITKDNLSFAQATKLALSSLLESARQSDLVPRRDGFEYLDMIKPFELGSYASRGAKLKLAQRLAQPPSESATNKRKAIRLEELLFKHNHNEENMEPGELQELAKLLAEVQLTNTIIFTSAALIPPR